MAEQRIRTATASDEASIVAVVTLAFGSDPAARWTWPDPHLYVQHFPAFQQPGPQLFHGGICGEETFFIKHLFHQRIYERRMHAMTVARRKKITDVFPGQFCLMPYTQVEKI